MRVRTLEIRWHDGKPIASCDFQPIGYKKARPAQTDLRAFARQSYRLATAGEDNHVRLWMVHPNMMPPALAESASGVGEAPAQARPPRVEYLATLSRHTAAVNVVRFSPNGELIASAGDDGMIIIWHSSSAPNQAAYGSDADEVQFEKEFWRPRTTFKCTTMQVYDLAWSPSGEYILTGSTDNVARVFSVDGKCMTEIAEHHHYVQGVAWDPLNEYIATQSSDRSMHVHSISHKHGALEVHAVGKNARMTHQQHSRTPSRPRIYRRESTASDTESVITSISEQPHREDYPALITPAPSVATPTPSVASTPSQAMFPPPPIDRPSSRRSSFSGSNAPSSPALYASSRYARSPSPAPALPAIRASPQTWTSRLYGDESFTNFFRRLSFSPDGALLLTPAGQSEDVGVTPSTSRQKEEPGRGRKGSSALHPTDSSSLASSSSVLIYSRANFARSPVAQLPGHKKASIAVKFSPILYELRQGVSGAELQAETKHVAVERGREETVSVDVGASSSRGTGTGTSTPALLDVTPISSPTKHTVLAPLAMPAPLPAQMPSALTLPSPALSASDSMSLRAFSPVPSISKPPTPAPSANAAGTSSVFALPYRMLFAVATMDTIAIHDTQQAGPMCILTKLHYDEFTDMSWSPDGQCLILASRDGYCTLVVFDDIISAHHTQQPALQFQAVAHAHSLPVTTSAMTPAGTPSLNSVALPSVSPALVLPPSASAAPSAPSSASPAVVPAKRSNDPPLTPASSVGGDMASASTSTSTVADAAADTVNEPPKKKRRVALTRVGEVGQ
ncbi:WD40 repeat-like protein [Peniophora sp. CONT]|nr:WD40 repeat-like protein [Peniophora sp. CONT]